MEKRLSLPSALVHDCNVSSQESEVRKLLVQEPVGATFKLFGCYKAKKKRKSGEKMRNREGKEREEREKREEETKGKGEGLHT